MKLKNDMKTPEIAKSVKETGNIFDGICKGIDKKQIPKRHTPSLKTTS